jgi:hypothetical protein
VIYYRYAFHPNSASTKTGAAIQSGRLVHSLPDTNARSARLKGMGEGAAGQRAGTAAYDAPYFAAACTAGRERKCGITSSPTIRYCSTILSSGVPHPFARGLLADAEIGRHFDGPLTGTNDGEPSGVDYREWCAHCVVDVHPEPISATISRRSWAP